MQTTFVRTAAAVFTAALSASFTSGAQAAEPSLNDILGSNFAVIGDNNLSFASLGIGGGSALNFVLLSENTAWAATQAFGITDGATSVTVFGGPATAGATSSYTLKTGLTGASFASNNGINPNQYSPGGSDADFLVLKSKTADSTYALAYEDYHYGSSNDHNDMVVQMSVSAVPEPETYALMLAGLGMVGTLASRRRSAKV